MESSNQTNALLAGVDRPIRTKIANLAIEIAPKKAASRALREECAIKGFGPSAAARWRDYDSEIETLELLRQDLERQAPDEDLRLLRVELERAIAADITEAGKVAEALARFTAATTAADEAGLAYEQAKRNAGGVHSRTFTLQNLIRRIDVEIVDAVQA